MIRKFIASTLGLTLLSSPFVGSNQPVYSKGENPYADFNWYYVTDVTEYSRGYSSKHRGLDILAYKDPVYSPQDGKVLSAGYFKDGGNYVAIMTTDRSPDNNKKLVIRNLHLESKKVKTGEKVERGQKIAISGNTGEDSDGYHLHIDVNDAETYDGKKFSRSNTIDPKYFWPRIFNGPTLVPHEYVDSNLEPDYDNPEWYFEDTLVEYVGEDTFLNWLSDQPEEEKTLSNFKQAFNISDKLEKSLKETTIEKQ
ncbi:M23 family metallopeptidase [Brevibacillus halotolerans]|uniref:M23 family metallopeptidase n=1 Tax=Brevibacillus TaxID=55080 RepID=UPI00215BEF88|nr:MULTISPECIES: M23 family metallopeptidase [Brevibacillus]MCR8964193.1 M23 family metallopeptidase [Brevibacillus laterosporus]MCZ0836348.1 M23 family metallopeptidase [Brevibacillus halotolerans]